eukprot:1637857-Pyramimonas_sp.AAC.1
MWRDPPPHICYMRPHLQHPYPRPSRPGPLTASPRIRGACSRMPCARCGHAAAYLRDRATEPRPQERGSEYVRRSQDATAL